jgi:hypothetical protein
MSLRLAYSGHADGRKLKGREICAHSPPRYRTPFIRARATSVMAASQAVGGGVAPAGKLRRVELGRVRRGHRFGARPAPAQAQNLRA